MRMRSQKHYRLSWATALSALTFVFILWSGASVAAERPVVVASFSPVANFSAAILRDIAEVRTVMGEREDLHEVTVTPQQRRLIAEADVLVGLGFPEQVSLDGYLTKTRKETQPLFFVAEALSMDDVLLRGGVACSGHHDHSHHDHHLNEHVWHDPIYAQQMVSFLSDKFQEHWPTHAETIEANEVAYLDAIDDVHSQLQQAFELDENPRRVGTFHNAYPYFFDRYGLPEPLALTTTPDRALRPKEFIALKEELVRENIDVVFVEPQFDSKFVERLREELSFRVMELDPVGTFDGKDGQGYLDLLRNNGMTIANALKQPASTAQVQP